MLAEIYLLQLEAIARTTKDLAPVSNTPFVPVTLPQTARSRDNSGPPGRYGGSPDRPDAA